MNTFANAVDNQEARTLNGMKARKTTASALTDLFFKIGASRGKNIIPSFTAAYVEDKEMALRIVQWARDVRSGAGERQLFRDILLDLDKSDIDSAKALMSKVGELGRWDDLLLDFQSKELKDHAFSLIKKALDSKNGLAAKWMPRKGPMALALRNYLGMSPKTYRKTLVELTKVVETQMCSNEWDAINYSHVPSLAHSRYKKAFWKHSPEGYKAYVDALVKGDPSVKINAGAVYPYDVLKGFASLYGSMNYNKTELEVIKAQWEALPNYIGEASVLPLVDVSGSMTCAVGSMSRKANPSLSCLDVAVSLGLYCADKNKGEFKDMFLTFSSKPEMIKMKGNILEKVKQMSTSNWSGSTNLHAAFDKILSVAKNGNVPQENMPTTLLIMSDMQFNSCVDYDDSAIQMIERKYEQAGYTMPSVIFWNINSYDNVPVSFDKRGTALISGFSPSILKSVLSGNMSDITPEGIMRKTVCVPRYDI